MNYRPEEEFPPYEPDKLQRLKDELAWAETHSEDEAVIARLRKEIASLTNQKI